MSAPSSLMNFLTIGLAGFTPSSKSEEGLRIFIDLLFLGKFITSFLF